MLSIPYIGFSPIIIFPETEIYLSIPYIGFGVGEVEVVRY